MMMMMVAVVVVIVGEDNDDDPPGIVLTRMMMMMMMMMMMVMMGDVSNFYWETGASEMILSFAIASFFTENMLIFWVLLTRTPASIKPEQQWFGRRVFIWDDILPWLCIFLGV